MSARSFADSLIRVDFPLLDKAVDLLPFHEISPTISEALATVRSDRSKKTSVRNQLLSMASPHVEPLNQKCALLTFVLDRPRDEGPFRLIGFLTNWSVKGNELRYSLDLDLWVLTIIRPIPYVASYLIWQGGIENPLKKDEHWDSFWKEVIIDPRSKDKMRIGYFDGEEQVSNLRSVVSTCDSYCWKHGLVDINSFGKLVRSDFESKITAVTRPLWLWTPREVTTADELDLIVTFDGAAAFGAIPIPYFCETLRKEGRLRPTAVLMIGNSSTGRLVELACHDGMARAVIEEFIPWAEQQEKISKDPRRSTITGFSLGGIMALEMAFRYPERFGNVLAQSPAISFMNTGTKTYSILSGESQVPDIRIAIDVGAYETMRQESHRDILSASRMTKECLENHGILVDYFEMPSAHDYAASRISFPDRLLKLVGI